MLQNIAVLTTNRSEYGLLRPLLNGLAGDRRFNLRLLVGGSHLLSEFGNTVNGIRADGFAIAREIPFLSSHPVPAPEAIALAKLSDQLGRYFAESKPDALVLLGDRYELLAAAAVALVMDVPIAHVSGGDVTEGAIDNQVRHALTKLAHLHFPATETYKRNLLAMGEEEWRITVSGEPGLDELASGNCLPRIDLFRSLGIPSDAQVILATFHPETIANAITPDFVGSVAESLLNATPYHLLFTAANFDPGGREINARAGSLALGNPRVTYLPSLGSERYRSMLRYAALMLGNSSSGLVEAQTFALPVLDVGKRQQGRLANANVIHVAADPEAVLAAVPAALAPAFRKRIQGLPNLYGDGHAVPRILEALAAADPSKLALKKSVFRG
ncbi:MAG: UDP-N-acetylglucosamine 2-epimerase (hydrolyzing) [Fibrobacteres bacterium]|nr:UDP-N-acetylglucosamine 2-epimerase (hydrolyzing) [Fibrobacterota bacterium]